LDIERIMQLSEGVEALMTALKYRDAHTELHCVRVVGLSHEMGQAMGLSETQMRILMVAAVFHDIGKVGIPDQVLFKDGRLQGQEWELMQSHTEKGEDIVRALNAGFTDEVARSVRHHHERIDGNGYPDGLIGDAIPLFSRIIAIVDSYDAMTETRTYRAPMTHREAIDTLLEEGGSKFDPEILSTFLHIIESSPHRAMDRAT